ncbi:MAG: hypothetical protein ABSA51_01870 [Anaerolineaceae bacterium]|jgi:hypothetical protein
MTSTPDSHAISQALNWIVSLLGRFRFPYHVVGGVALRYAHDVLKVKSVHAEESVLNLPLLAVYNELGYQQMPGISSSTQK